MFSLNQEWQDHNPLHKLNYPSLTYVRGNYWTLDEKTFKNKIRMSANLKKTTYAICCDKNHCPCTQKRVSFCCVEVGMTAQICTRTWNVTTKYNLVKLTWPKKFHKNLPPCQIYGGIYHLNFSQESFIENNLFFFTNLLLTFNLTHIHAWKLPSRTRVWSFGQRAVSLKQLGVKGLAQGVEPTVVLREGASFALLPPLLGFILPIRQWACFTNFQYKDETICQFFEIKMTLIQISVLEDCAKPWNLSSDEICLHPAPTI